MEREIEFRAWGGYYSMGGSPEDEGQWFYWNPVDEEFPRPWKQWVGEWIGLKDKNGKKVYEGDVVYCKSWNPDKYRIEFREGGFCMCYGDGEETPIDIHFMSDSTGIHFEVISNIYENTDPKDNA